MEINMESEPVSQEIHFLENKKVWELVAKKWPDCIGLLDQATLPEPSPDPGDLEKWENEHRKARTQELATSLNAGETGTLRGLQQLLYEECFGVNAHPEQGTSWWQHSSGAPTPGGELSHSYPMNVINGVRVEDCSRLPFNGNTAVEMVNSLSDIHQKNALAAMIAQLAFPEDIRRIDRISESLVTQKPVLPGLVDGIDVIGARFLNLAKLENLSEDVSDPKILEILGQKPDRKISKMLAWRLLWNKFQKTLVSSVGTYKDPLDADVEVAIGQLLHARLSPDFQGLFRHQSLSGYKVEAINQDNVS